MKRVLIAGLVGGVAVYIWSFVSWTFIPWHMMQAFPQQEQVAQTLRATGAEDGVYMVPGMDHAEMAQLSEEEREAREEARKEAHREGPVAVVMYESEGSSPAAIMSYVTGIALDLIVALVAAFLLSMAAPALPGMGQRILFVLLIGVYTLFGTHLMNWNWMHYPFRFSLELGADTLVSALIMAIPLAILINPSAGSVVEEASDFEVSAGP